MKTYHLNDTLTTLKGPTQAQIIVNNQWAAVALNKFHLDSNVKFNITIDGIDDTFELRWDSDFSKAAMIEEIYMAYHGGEALAMFVMSVLCGFTYLEQSEIGTGFDYCFSKIEPDENDLNFLDGGHYVEISGILKETKSNTLKGRIKDKHEQIKKGGIKTSSSSVIVTLFSEPKTIKEIHS